MAGRQSQELNRGQSASPNTTCSREVLTLRIGQLLQEARKKAGLTQVEFAQKAKLAQSAVSSLESGERDPKLSMLVRWARACKVSVSELLSGL